MNATVQQAMDLLSGFSEREQHFALNILKQIPERRISDNSYVCEYGYVHGEFNNETIAAMEETEVLIRKIKAGEHVPRYNNFSEILAEIEAENNAKAVI